MVGFWKVIITVFLLYTVAIDGNRARRRRRQAPLPNPNPMANPMNQQLLPPNPQILNTQGQPPPPHQVGPNDIGIAKQGGQGGQGSRQYYMPYQGQYGFGTAQGLNYPYAGSGLGSYQYGYQPYGQYGGYNQYSGYGTGGYYNRPGYYSSNYYPSGSYGGYGGYGGSGGYGGYFWNAGQKQNINMFTVFLPSLLTLVICLIIV